MLDEIEALSRFNFTLEWLMAVQERNPESLRFGLVHVSFHDKDSLGNTYGARDAHNMLRDLAAQLRHTFRKTDLVARDGTEFWVLVPYTDAVSVTEKVSTMVEIASDKGLDIVDRSVAIFNLPDATLTASRAFNSATELLEHLRLNRAIARQWEHVVQAS